MEYSDYCSACLVTDVKMINFTSSKVDDSLCGIFRFPSKNKNASFCLECAAFCHKFYKFRLKCARAQSVLTQLRQDNYKITPETIRNVDRKLHKLASNMSLTSINSISINITQVEIKDENLNTDLIPSEKYFNETDSHIIKTEVKFIEEDILHDYNDQLEHFFDQNNTTTDNKNKNKDITNNEQKTKPHKKEYKNRKRKASTDNIESISDDEPLSNKVYKTNPKETKVTKKNGKKFDVNFFKDYATVVFLNPEDAKKELMLRKESSNYINSPFKCEFCFRGFEGEGTFDNHMKKHSIENGEYVCEICHLRFPEQRCLCKHRLMSHKRKFSCKLCSYVCYCTYQAKTHISLHKGKKYPCEECGEIFSMPNSLHMHKRVKHVTECVCALCGHTFATPRGLYSHRVKVHRQDKNEKLGPKCEECGIHFATAEAWKLHLVLSSKHNVSNGCKHCGDTFSSREELKHHMRAHSRNHAARRERAALPTACTICSKQFSDRPTYKSHMSSEHPNSDITRKLHSDELTPFVCETCGLAFKKHCFLTYHQRKHTGERPYKCKQCEKSFQLAGALSTHKAVHLQRRHACAVCHRHFTFKSALNKHMKVHLNIRPHRCDVCDKSFISPCDVRLHVKYVHNNVPWPKKDRTNKLQDNLYI